MHKWNLRFDGTSDPLTLIAELEEKIATYIINQDHEFETLEQLTRMATEYESVRQLTSSRAGIPTGIGPG